MSRIFLLSVLAAFGVGGLAAAQTPAPAQCVTLDDRPCYADAAPMAGGASELPASHGREALARTKARDLANAGECDRARRSADALGDADLIAEVQSLCGPGATPPPAEPAVQIW